MNSSLPGWYSQRRRTLAATVSVPRVVLLDAVVPVDTKNASTPIIGFLGFLGFLGKQNDKRSNSGAKPSTEFGSGPARSQLPLRRRTVAGPIHRLARCFLLKRDHGSAGLAAGTGSPHASRSARVPPTRSRGSLCTTVEPGGRQADGHFIGPELFPIPPLDPRKRRRVRPVSLTALPRVKRVPAQRWLIQACQPGASPPSMPRGLAPRTPTPRSRPWLRGAAAEQTRSTATQRGRDRRRCRRRSGSR